MHPFLENIGERLFNKPFGARDWILRAFSNDGLHWEKDASFRFNSAPLTAQAMSYYVGMGPEFELWFHTSVLYRGEGKWQSLLRSKQCTITAKELGVQNVYSPSWCGDRLYCVFVHESGKREVTALSIREGCPRIVPLSWEGLSNCGDVEDVFVLQDNDVWHAWLSVRCKRKTAIRYCTSVDGLFWTDRGVALESPYHSHWYQLANNPCVVPLGERGWRMYYRTGLSPAVGNVIASSFSDDLVKWKEDKTISIEPGGVWDRHGVGFPFVYYDRKNTKFVMYYAGYWGNSKAGNEVRDYWLRYGEQERIEHDRVFEE